MKRKTIYLTTFVIVFLAVTFWGSAEENGKKPVAVSPGSETEMVTVWQSCPTFSWSLVDQATSYRIAVFESVDGKLTPYEGMASISPPVISKQIPGPALSWTISSEESLKSGGMYTWYVQAVDATGNAVGPWSTGRIFQVEQEVRFAGIEEKLEEILKSYGVNDETAANVLKDMKAGVKEVVVRSAGSNNLPEVGGILSGTETPTRTLLGLNAGSSITTGTHNTFIGYFTGNATNSGSFNSFLGHYAGRTNTTGKRNSFLGYHAGFANTTASDNTFLGYYAGRANTTGYFNTFLGSYAGSLNTTGFNNSFIGYYAGRANTTGYFNTFLGTYAGRYNATATRNTFIGDESGYNTTTGSFNTFLGVKAGYFNTTGSYNNFLGYYAGLSNTAGNNNLILGVWAGNSNTTGSNNLFLGHYTGYTNTTGNDNTFLGYSAGYSNSTGGGNVFLGFKAGYYETTSNKLYIANSDTTSPLIYGEFNNNIIKINGKLGISITASPTHLIDVGNAGAYCDGGAWIDGSSRQFKNNIRDMTADEATEALNGLNPVKFYYKENETEEYLGFIAEDVPDLVATHDRKGLSPMDITAVLTKVVQELQRKNREQQNVIREYRTLISDLQERVATLEKK